MKKAKRSPAPDVVPHPRYGSEPLASGVRGISLEEILRGYWAYKIEEIYPESVLIADTSKQNYSVFPRECYVDMRRTCRSCKRPFIFFAAEQKHWFEVLRFYVDADCVHCPACRVQRRAAKQAVEHYAELITISQPNQDELQQLVDASVALLSQGILKSRSRSRLGHIKNMAFKQIPAYSGTLALAQALQGVDISASEGDKA